MKKLTIFIFCLFLFCNATYADANEKIYVVDINDAITPATVEIVKEAYKEKPDLIILRLNTPGGDLDSTLKIIQIIDNSEIPFVGYVYPKGAYAWSAGTFILLSTHVAAMAPNSVIGSCQPVYIGSEYKTINESKILNAVIAIMKERMRMHNRNFSLTEKFILENLNLNAEDAKKFNAIEIIADNENDLIEKINGMKINISGEEKILITKNSNIVYYNPSIKSKIMSILSNPLIASLLLMIGIYALIFGLSSPGIGAEIFGGLCILLGLIGLGFEINLIAIALLILGIVLIIYELSSHSFGFVGGIGVIALILGIIFIGPLSSPNFYVSQEFFNTLLYSIVFPSVIFGLFLIFAVTKIFKSQKKKPVIGEDLIGETAYATEDFENEGFVMYKGELWKAKNLNNVKILKGEKVKIKGRDEYMLIVEKI